MFSHKTAAKIFGIFFILTFLSYGIGSGLIDSIITTPDYLSNVYADQLPVIILAVGILPYFLILKEV